MTLLGYDSKGSLENNIKSTPSFLISAQNLPEFEAWHRGVFGK
jgi:hypothetical protein